MPLTPKAPKASGKVLPQLARDVSLPHGLKALMNLNLLRRIV